MIRRAWLSALVILCTLAGFADADAQESTNVSLVPFWDGESDDPFGRTVNRFGGNATAFDLTVAHTTDPAHIRTGAGAFRITTNGVLPQDDFAFVTLPLSGANGAYVDTRDLSPFQQLTFWLKNTTGAPFRLVVETKDYRDSNDHRVSTPFLVGTGSDWIQLSVSLDGTETWDATRARQIALVIETNQGSAVNGSLYVDDMDLVERGGALAPLTAPLTALATRIAQRQFRGIWGTRDRTSGLLPALSPYPDVCATNVLAGLLQMLPVAIEQGWLSSSDADAYVENVVATLSALDYAYVPPRYVDRVTLAPVFGEEESSVDAAMLYLALYRYKARASTPAPLRALIETELDRFDLASFSSPSGWRLAYREATGFTAGTYDGYSGEVWLISLAAHLSGTHHVDIGTHYHSGVNRVRAFLVHAARDHVVHTSPEFRPPFVQWLLPLFVDVSGRGVDAYPEPQLATNPHDNAVRYQLEVHAKSAALGRATRLQPDAGDDGSGELYRQFSLYEDFDRPDLVMPWSVAFSFLAEVPVAEAALREILRRELHGPLGLSDSTLWPSAGLPTFVAARSDFWNLALSTMALMQWLYGGNEDLAALPEVASALASTYSPRQFIGTIAAGTPIAASHFAELRARVDSLRADSGLAAYAWTDPLLSPGVTTIRALHLTDLRDALDDVLLARGASAQPWIVDPNAVEGMAITAQQVNELRAIVVELEP